MAAAEPATPKVKFGNDGFHSTFINDNCDPNSYPIYDNYFLWVSHGESTSGQHNLQETFGTPARITQFGRPLEITTGELINEVLGPSQPGSYDQDNLQVPTGYHLDYFYKCHPVSQHYRNDYEAKKVKMRSKNKYQNVTHLSPLVFSTQPHDMYDANGVGVVIPRDENKYLDNGLRFTDIMGLYYHSVSQNTLERLINWNQITQFCQANGGYLYYKDIFKIIRDTCKARNINYEETALGIYSCRIPNNAYQSEYFVNSAFSNAVSIQPTAIERNIHHEEMSFIPDLSEVDTSQLESLSPFIIENMNGDKNIGWNALAKRKDQGCGLNVLSYFGLIPQRDAREMTVCLTKGTSIVEICRYINDYLVRKGIHRTFTIQRHSLLDAVRVVMNMFSTLPYVGHWVTFIKIYKTPTHNHILSNRGHTFAFTCYKNEKDMQIHIVDPHKEGLRGQLYPNENAPEEAEDNIDLFYQFIVDSIIAVLYPNLMGDETCADVIYVFDTASNFGTRAHETIDGFTQKYSPNSRRPVTEAGLYGEGMKKKKTRRRRKKKKETKRRRKYSERKR